MNRFHRGVVIAATLIATAASGVVFAAPALADDCQTRTSSSSATNPENMIWMDQYDWHRWGHFRVSQCRGSIQWEPEGIAYEGDADVYVRVRFYNSRGNTAGVTDWMVGYGRGPNVRLVSMVAGREFSLECRAVDPGDRSEGEHCLGKLRF